ncbi:metal cation transporter, ZIP family protein [Besnoitia besnoiti]|uniref:Metal cation transporter, ZIP family protein n=1 Tax=Besnoitia besnoiti TaxID=94643 RepID=A0A2A9MHZ1_BESBE|nr:metal cation transporter, ZIP family protein [Besnoitia besnoiti]PFH35207.1 metal cation transporter, ZIP family protein [Besnoitia besnoiti]
MKDYWTETDHSHGHHHVAAKHVEVDSHHQEGEGGGLPLWAAKLLSALLLATVSACCFLLPVYIARQARKHARKGRTDSRCRLFQTLLSVVNCFAAGAFLGLAVIHVLPEAVSQLNQDGFLLVLPGSGVDHQHTYNIAYVLAAVGFTAMLGLELLLAGGHAHCHHDSLDSIATGPGGGVFLAAPDSARGRPSPSPSPRSLPHSSHHHAQHHILCTAANYCPDCDDCLEAVTTVNGVSGERDMQGDAGGAGSVELRLVARRPTAPSALEECASCAPAARDSLALPGGQRGDAGSCPSKVACLHSLECRRSETSDGAAQRLATPSTFVKCHDDEASDIAVHVSATSPSSSNASGQRRESLGFATHATRQTSGCAGKQTPGCCSKDAGNAVEHAACGRPDTCCGARTGCDDGCGTHSHCPDSDSRVHSGSIGANVQGGDHLGGRHASGVRGVSEHGECAGGPRKKTLSNAALPSVGGCQKHESCNYYGKREHSVPPLHIQAAAAGSGLHGESKGCERLCHGRTDSGHILHRHHGGRERSRVSGLGGHAGQKLKGFLRCFKGLDGAKISLAVSLGVHAIFEGIILGTTQESENVWIATLAILGHKGAEAVAVATTLLKLNMGKIPFILMLAGFALASPVGIFIGVFAAVGGSGVSGVFNALAVGAILYATNEMLSEFTGRCSRKRRFVKFLAFLVGLGLLFGLDLIHAPFCHHHNHSHGYHAHEGEHDHAHHHH